MKCQYLIKAYMHKVNTVGSMWCRYYKVDRIIKLTEINLSPRTTPKCAYNEKV